MSLKKKDKEMANKKYLTAGIAKKKKKGKEENSWQIGKRPRKQTFTEKEIPYGKSQTMSLKTNENVQIQRLNAHNWFQTNDKNNLIEPLATTAVQR